MSGSTRRRLQLRRGASAESALSPPKIRASGLRGPIFERQRTNTIDCGAISRRSPLMVKRHCQGKIFSKMLRNAFRSKFLRSGKAHLLTRWFRKETNTVRTNKQ